MRYHMRRWEREKRAIMLRPDNLGCVLLPPHHEQIKILGKVYGLPVRNLAILQPINEVTYLTEFRNIRGECLSATQGEKS